MTATTPMRRTKIVATLGPASRNETTMRQLIEANASVFRFNYSHAEYDELEKAYRNVRRISQELNKPVAILSDLQGPKFRVGFFEEGESIQLTQGQFVQFIYSTDKGNANTLTCNVKELVEALEINNAILLDDGNIELRVRERISPTAVRCEVINSGPLKERKGVNVPDISIPVPAMTDKDRTDCLFALKQGTDFIALSFVQSANDVRQLRDFLTANGVPSNAMPKIVCKIEKPQAVDRIDEILAETDAIMVARGDLGVELRPEYVPSVQKMLIAKANAAGKPVITATQMLESMIKNPVPTRAEVSDVANAIFDGTDAVMLSAETASGQYPVQAFTMMDRIAREAENHMELCRNLPTPPPTTADNQPCFPQSIARSAVLTAQQCNAKAIVVLSHSGAMATRLSKCKPNVPIITFTPDSQVYHQINLCYGTYPVQFNSIDNTDAVLRNLEQHLCAQGLINSGDTIVICAGTTPLLGMANSLRLYTVNPPTTTTSPAKTCSPLATTTA